MRNFLYALALGGLLLSGGCAAWMATPPPDPNREKSIPRKAMDRAEDIDVDSNINQINQALMILKQNDTAPATLEEAKTALKKDGVTEEMWFDQVTKKPLVYDAPTGTVQREGVAPGAPPSAGSPNAPKGVNIPGGGGFGGE